MKKILTLFAVTCFALAVKAQDSTKMMDTSMHHKMGMHGMHMMKDCVMMHGGKMMVMKGGKTMDMTEDMTMSDGTMVMTDGSVKKKDGTTATLKDGDCVYMDGKMGSMKMHKPMKMQQ